jgi:hypothetical protein
LGFAQSWSLANVWSFEILEEALQVGEKWMSVVEARNLQASIEQTVHISRSLRYCCLCFPDATKGLANTSMEFN